MTPDWRDSAACRTESPRLFFGPDDEREGARLVREALAKAVCSACPVRVPCADFARNSGQKAGIWGGLTEDERARERRRRMRRAASARKAAA